MDFVVEDGSVVSGANTYASMNTLDTYHESRGNADWVDGDDDLKAAALVRAMDFLESQCWAGVPTTCRFQTVGVLGLRNIYGSGEYMGAVGAEGYQSLQWPRYGAYIAGNMWPMDQIPKQLVKGLAEAAYVEFVEPGALTPSLERGGMIETDSIDGVSSTTYMPGAPAGTIYHKVAQHINQLIRSSNVVQLVRA